MKLPESFDRAMRDLRRAQIPVYAGNAAFFLVLSFLPLLTLLPEHLRQQRASGAALAAWEKIGRGERGDAGSLTPNYLRLSQAERERKEREAKSIQ